MQVAEKIAALKTLSTAELAAEFDRLHGKKPRSRSPAWMRKRIAFKMQECAYGGLSGPARAELERLTEDLQLPQAAPKRQTANDKAQGPRRLPKPGSVIQREYLGNQIRVQVLQDGFEWNGNRYGSLTAVALAITGSKWNGWLFFGLTPRSKS